MSGMIEIIADDGFILPCYLSEPDSKVKGGIVIVQEIFGLTAQLTELADQYAEQGYRVIVPALFARVSDNIKLEYTEAQKGLSLVNQCKEHAILCDLKAATKALNHPQVSIIGFCWGGGIAYLAACELDLHSGVAFYGTRLSNYYALTPKCAFQFHFGESDTHSPPVLIEKMKQSAPDSEFYVYENAGHAFANHHKSAYEAKSAALAHARVMQVLSRKPVS